MAYETGDLVWARMKGFPPWPAKIIEPKPEVKKPKGKDMHFVFFFGSENYSWIADDQIYEYAENKERYSQVTRTLKGFKEALAQIEEAHQKQPEKPARQPTTARQKLPSVDDDLLAIFPERSDDQPVMKVTPSKPAGRKSTDGRKAASSASSDKKIKSKSDIRKPVGLQSRSSLGVKRSFGSKASPSHLVKKRKLSDGEERVTHSDAEEMDEEAFGDDTADRPPTRTKTYSSNFRPERDLMTSGYLAEQLYPLPTQREPKNVVPTQSKIGFLGLGIMGSALVSNLLSSGHDVTVWNRTPSKCRDFVSMGATKASTPLELVQLCDIVISCVSDSAALKDLVFGKPYGLLQGIRPGKSYVDMSTVDVDTISDISDAVMVKGGRFLEAPLIGSRQPAEEGQLVVLASGDKSLYEDCSSCFEAIGKRSLYCGEIGSATKMKLMVSLMGCSMLANLAESLALAEKLSLDQEELLKVIDLSGMSCQLIRTQGSAMILSKYNEPHCRLHLAQKDLKLAINLSESVDQPMHVGAAVNELFKKAKAKGYGDHDVAAVFRAADM